MTNKVNYYAYYTPQKFSMQPPTLDIIIKINLEKFLKEGGSTVTINLVGEKKEHKTREALFSVLSAVGFSSVYITETEVTVRSPEKREQGKTSKKCAEDFLIIENDNIEKINAQKGIVLFKAKNRFAPSLCVPPDFVGIIDSEDTKAAKKLREDSIRTVTCGLSSKNTITFSSVDNMSAVVSLQRDITTLSGDVCEPCDVPLVFSKEYGEYPLLAAVAVLLLSGTEFSQNGIAL